MATVGELVVNMRVATASFSNDLNKATKLSFDSARQIERSFGVMTNMIRAAVTTAVTSLAYMTDKVIESAHQIELSSQRTGLGIEAYQGLSGAARLAGVETETFNTIIGRLAKNLFSAQTGNEKMAAAFRMVGVDVMKVKSTEEVLFKMSDTFSKLGDGRIDKIGVGMTVMGRGANVMLPFLSQGPAGIRSIVAELEALGYVIDEKNIRQLAEEREKIEKLELAFDGLKKQIVIGILPQLQELTKTLLEMSKQGDFKAFIENAITSFKALAIAAVVVGTEIKNLIYDFKLLTMPIKNLPSWEEIEYTYERNYTRAQKEIDRINTKYEPSSEEGKNKSKVGGGLGPGLDLDLGPSKAEKAYQNLVDKVNEQAIAFEHGQRYADVYRMTLQGLDRQQILAVLSAQDQLAAIKGIPAALDPVIHGTEELDTTLQDMRERGFKYWEESLTPLNKLYIKMQDLKEIMAADATYAAIYADALKGMEKEYAKLLEEGHKPLERTRDLVDRLQKSFVKAFSDGIFGANSFKDALGNMLIEMGKMIFEITVLVPIVEKLSEALRGIGRGGGGGGGFLSGFFGGLFDLFGGVGMASGGGIGAGQTRLVGERGPELFTPNVSGMIIPNNALGGQVVFNIDARGADAGVEERIRRALRESEERAVNRSVIATRELSLRRAG